MKQPTELYIGLMSGTSIDGIDVALVDLSANTCKLLCFYHHSIDSHTRQQLVSLSAPVVVSARHLQNRIELLAELDVIMGHAFADSVNQLIEINQVNPDNVVAIGSHGQTIRHRPEYPFPFSLQIGDANIIAQKTGIKTVADFRRMDIAAGGQGAPLTPAFHKAVLSCEIENRIILNLGGIANITLLPKDKQQATVGFDTGPANTLIDAYYQQSFVTRNEDFDRNSQWAQQGRIHYTLLNSLLNDPYFSQDYPKSTGREYFCLSWLEKHIAPIQEAISAKDIQRTLLQLSVKSIAGSIRCLALKTAIKKYNILVGGGGMHNAFFLDCLSKELNQPLQTTNAVGVDGDYLEAMTFAWLAKQRLEESPGNLPSVTGASQAKILGALYCP